MSLKLFAFSLLTFFSSLSFATSSAGSKSYDCQVSDPTFSHVQFTLSDENKILNGRYDFSGDPELQLPARSIAMTDTTVSRTAENSLFVHAHEQSGHDGVDFVLTISSSGDVKFRAAWWMDCKGYSSWESPITCSIK